MFEFQFICAQNEEPNPDSLKAQERKHKTKSFDNVCLKHQTTKSTNKMDVMTGGAFDDGNFTARIAHSSLPAITSITYEGTYNQHFFFTGEEKENLLSCTYSTLLSRDPISNQVEYYLAVGLNSKYDGPGIKEFKRPPLNLVVCIDVSGSMGIGFNYKETKTKMDVAIESLKILLSQLKPEDSFSLISFDTKASVLIPLSKVETADQTEVGILGLFLFITF